MKTSMKSALVGMCIVVGILAGQLNSAIGSPIKGKTQGYCNLRNVDKGQEMYNGRCTIKEIINGQAIVYIMTMKPHGEFKFASADGGKTWYIEEERAKFKDEGHSAIFRWGYWELKVEEN